MTNDKELAARALTELKGVGARLAQTLEKLGLQSIQDLLFHLPFRYLDRTRITPISHLQTNIAAVVQGRIIHSQIEFGRRRSLVCNIEDQSGCVRLRFFHFSGAQKANLSIGTEVRCYGEARQGKTGLEFYHPEYELITAASAQSIDSALTPIYALTEGITQARLRKVIEQAVEILAIQSPEELLPESVNRHFGIKSLAEAVCYLHSPPPDTPIGQLLKGVHPYQQRLAFEELLAHYLARQTLREKAQSEHAVACTAPGALHEKLLASLPFTLTDAQQRVTHEIASDLQKPKPMLRMLQGDVGSGKTLVAAMAALQVVAAQRQVAIVAPTEILAEQHLANFTRWLTPLGIEVGWLVGKLGVAKRRQALAALAAGEWAVVVGTHALFQEDVHFDRLGLAIIDEQHRFGVHQRLSLRKKSAQGDTPHQLVMTATPIPRTLAMTAFAELDYSVIDQLPPGRTPVNTVLVGQARRPEVVERIDVACQEGRQVYWVCTLVEESETLAAANAEQTAELLQAALPNANIGLIHGRLKPKDKEHVMAEFTYGKLNLLVATTVIEVGVDVPNASLMVIENPERLGLAQLHQLRGRVGRGQVASHCVLLYGDPLSFHAKERLNVLRESTDGFVIAERDLQLRGPGELLGTRQTGDMQYRLADPERDRDMLDYVHEIGRAMFLSDREAVDKLIDRWFGARREYGQV